MTDRGYADDFVKLVLFGDRSVYALTGSPVFWNDRQTEVQFSAYAATEAFLQRRKSNDAEIDLDALGKSVADALVMAMGRVWVDPPAPVFTIVIAHRKDSGIVQTGRCRIESRLNTSKIIVAATSECRDTSADLSWAYGNASFLRQLYDEQSSAFAAYRDAAPIRSVLPKLKAQSSEPIPHTAAIAYAKAVIRFSSVHVRPDKADISEECDCALLSRDARVWTDEPVGVPPPGHPSNPQSPQPRNK